VGARRTMSTRTSKSSANDVATPVPEAVLGGETVTAMPSELDEAGETATAMPMEGSGLDEAATMLATMQTATGTAGDGTDGGEATVKSMGSRAVKARSSR